VEKIQDSFFDIERKTVGKHSRQQHESEGNILARVAWMYYMQGLTQEEIGTRLDFSRTKVTRLLARARELEIVEISINPSYRACFDTEERLRAALPLQDVIVVPSGKSIEETRSGVGRACADFLQRNLSEGDVLGCAWGRSLYHAGRCLRPHAFRQFTVVQLMGGLNPSARINPQDILETIAKKLNATGVWLNAPAIVRSPEVRDALLEDDSVCEAIRQWHNCTKALVGIGDTSERASLVYSKALSTGEIRELKAMGAVGDINARFFDRNGVPVLHTINDRVISLSLSALKKIPVRIAVTAGAEKALPLRSAIIGGYINILITDEKTADAVLQLHEKQGNSQSS
jgi:DNA-binding transcriptional regulator LsrR (DeoR family)